MDGLPELEKGCLGGDSSDCVLAGQMHLRAGSASRALSWLQRACEQDNGVGCMLTAQMHARAKAVKESTTAWSKAVALLSASCKAGGQPASCLLVGMALTDGAVGLTADKEEALRLLDAGCDEGDAACCMNAGRVLDMRGADLPGMMTNSQASLRYKCACNVGHGEGCRILAQRMEFDGMVSDDKEEKERLAGIAEAHYRQGCDLDDTASCAAYGSLLVQQKRSHEALPYLEKAAAADDPAACLLAGLIYAYGRQEEVTPEPQIILESGLPVAVEEVEYEEEVEVEASRMPGVAVTQLAPVGREPAYKQANTDRAIHLLQHCCHDLDHSPCCSSLDTIVRMAAF